MSTIKRLNAQPETAFGVAVTLLAYLLFSILTYLARFSDLWLNVAVLGMLGMPVVWAWRTAAWAEMGFASVDIKTLLLWGGIGGALSALIGVVVIGEIAVPDDLCMQLLIAVPLMALMASPFQEFFFRGWLQSRFEAKFGPWAGLLLALILFTLWHFTLPIFGPFSAFPMTSLKGILGTVASGFIYCFLFMRTRNLIVVSVAHAIPLITFVVIGAASVLDAL